MPRKGKGKISQKQRKRSKCGTKSIMYNTKKKSKNNIGNTTKNADRLKCGATCANVRSRNAERPNICKHRSTSTTKSKRTKKKSSAR